MKTRILLLTALLALGGITWNIAPKSRQPAPAPTVAATPAPAPAATPAATDPTMAGNSAPAAQPSTKQHSQPAASEASTAPTDGSLVINGYTVQDPTARVALNFVGTDPDADAYWSQAINNPDLPAEERKDLIEDLNEDGLSDPKHPTAQDMPIIASRLQMLEAMAPYAMDDANANAMAEAYKDLWNLYNGLPVD